jgi:hypothetical protein
MRHITLTVTDNAGKTASKTINVTVSVTPPGQSCQWRRIRG